MEGEKIRTRGLLRDPQIVLAVADILPMCLERGSSPVVVGYRNCGCHGAAVDLWERAHVCRVQRRGFQRR